MQITALTNPSPLGDLQGDAQATSGQQGKTAAASAERQDRREANGTVDPAANVQASESAPVTLSASSAAAEILQALPPVYAEIWKNGVKIAIVDTNGGVRAVGEMIATNRGAEGGGGTMLAARRAAEIAGSIGGEIHIAGQQIDARTLAMRAKLSVAYGV